MILVFEPEKIISRIIVGTILVAVVIGCIVVSNYWKSKLNSYNLQQETILQLQSLIAERDQEVSKLRSEVDKNLQIQENNKKIELALAKCYKTVDDQKSKIKIYKDYYYMTTGR